MTIHHAGLHGGPVGVVIKVSMMAVAASRVYPCEQIHTSIIGLLPRKHDKSQMEITTRIYNDIHSVRIGRLVWCTLQRARLMYYVH